MNRLPTEIKRLRGTLQPCRTNHAEPMPTEPLGEPPAQLNADERKAWRELKRMVVPGVLTIQDRFVVELLCQLMARLRERSPPLTPAERTNLTFCLSHLGLTPVDRARTSIASLLQPQHEADDDNVLQFK